jgi:hypothetical protein
MVPCRSPLAYVIGRKAWWFNVGRLAWAGMAALDQFVPNLQVKRAGAKHCATNAVQHATIERRAIAFANPEGFCCDAPAIITFSTKFRHILLCSFGKLPCAAAKMHSLSD